MSSTIHLVSGAAASLSVVTPAQAAAQTVARRVPSPRAQVVTRRMALLSRMWASMSDSERLSFARLGQRYSVSPHKSTSRPKDLFVSLNFARLFASLPVLREVGTLPDAPPDIPDYTVSATLVNSIFSLVLTPAQDFSGLVLLTALRPQSAGVMRLDKTKYQHLQALSALSVDGTDVGASYGEVYGPPSVNTRVGVCLTPLSPLGFPGCPLYHDTLVTGGG